MNSNARFDAVVFDLLTALLDSWSVWNRAAGSPSDGLKWRRTYLKLTYDCGVYRPYEDLVREAACEAGVASAAVERLIEHWDTLEPWSEAPLILNDLARRGVALGVVTNCSTALGRRAAQRVGAPFAAVVTAEEVGFYKPRPEPYREILDRLGTAAGRTLFVAGSPADIPGAAGVGMPVFWHNRMALPFVDDKARPVMIADTLQSLAELVR